MIAPVVHVMSCFITITTYVLCGLMYYLMFERRC